MSADTKKREEMLLVMELSSEVAEIASLRDKLTDGDYQGCLEAVIMAAIRRTKEIHGVKS